MRPDWDEYFFGLAAAAASRATCPRAQIGTVLVKQKLVVGTGYNGNPAGAPHCPSEGAALAEHLALLHCPTARHSERNAVINAVGNLYGATAYVVGPRRVCVDCDALLRSVGIADVRHRESVPSLDGVIREVNAWQAATFPRATPASVVEHLRREVAELVDDPTDTSELADVVFLAVGLAYELGLGVDGLTRIVSEKLAVNRRRVWSDPDEFGVVEHLRDGAEPCRP